MKPINFFYILFFAFLIPSVEAQLTVDAELRPRFEYRHGFKTLFPDETNPAAFVSQRTRLNSLYTTEKMSFYLSLQDVRVWGDVPQLNTSDKNGLSIHQAWGEIFFFKHFSMRFGRQEISYDDHRIFGNVEWAQQARSHDAALLRFNNEKFKADAGFAFNQDTENVIGNTLMNPNTYKSLQYLWVHKEWKDFSTSFLFLNNGMQYIDSTNSEKNDTKYSQTLGSHLKYSKEKINFIANLYCQFGKDITNNNLNAYLLSFETNYTSSAIWTLTLGTELLSGNNNGVPINGKNNAFSPLYGTNHKFNGLMDYFYVGNHSNNVGLWDVYVKNKFSLNQKSNLMMALHNFSSPSEITKNVSTQLGIEADLVYTYSLDKNVSFAGGYSHLFAAEGMENVKNNFDHNSNNWGWIMVTIKPVLFKNQIQ